MIEDTPLHRKLQEARATIRALQDELAETNSGLIALTLELERRVEARTGELEAANHDLALLYERAKALDHMKTRFFANVSHDLRTPLTLILGPTSALLASDSLDKEARARLEVVERNARILLRQVNDLLDVAKLDAGKLTANYATANLTRLLRLTVSSFEALAAERRITLSIDTPPALPAQVDAEKLQRIVINLLANAFKFTPDGGTITCRLRTGGGSARVIVEDSGPGVPLSLRESIFEPFHQGDETTAQRSGGAGLGLAIVKEFVELLGGGVGVGDALGGGACFEVTIPLLAPPGARRGSAGEALSSRQVQEMTDTFRTAAENPPADPSLVGDEPLVLIVEDNPDMNRFIAQGLAGQYRTAAAYDGGLGLELALTLLPDAIITDMMMPKMTGEQLVQALRGHAECDGIPIILLTARADDDLRVRLLRTGAQDYLVKPFVTEELRARVGNLITMKRVRDLLRRDLDTRLREVEDLAREVIARRVEAERANRAKDEFLGNAAHELRTPLTSLVGNLELATSRISRAIAAGAVGAEAAVTLTMLLDLHRRAHLQVDRLTRLVNDILYASRVQDGKLEICLVPADLGAHIRSTLEDLRYLLGKRPLKIELPSDDPVWVIADLDRIGQVLTNYLSNGLKYSAGNQPITVGLDLRGTVARVWVRNEGPGVPLAEQVRIWERAYQIPGTAQLSGSYIGLGLGLYISRAIIEAHDGQVGVESTPGNGATFWFTLPLADAAP